MKQLFSFILLCGIVWQAYGQTDYTWWNELHDWKNGDPGWRHMMIMSPGFFGPNALPVPELKRGFLAQEAEFELTASNHFHSGDPTQDISYRGYLPFAEGKIAVEVYGVLFEYYHYTEEIRNERISRDEDGQGFAIGDLYFTTLIQVFKDRKFPNTLFRAALKTASGSNLDAARYIDSPGYFFDLSFSKDLGNPSALVFRPHAMLGFYSWQTNDEMNLQNDALTYGVGIDLEKHSWRFTPSFTGYHGYKDNGDRPMQLNFEARKDYKKKAFRIQYQHGLHDWLYRTVRFSFLWKFER